MALGGIVRVAAICLVVAALSSKALAGFGYSLNGGLPNLQELKGRIVAYYDSGRQNADVARVDAQARVYVASRLAAGAKKPAVVFDIDDTSLSTYPYEKQFDFAFNVTTWDSWESHDRFPAIKPTLDLVKYLRAHGVAVFFITGRREPLRASTARELAQLGYPTPTGLYLRPVSDHASSVIPYKSGTRSKIAAMGYDVLASVGDQWSDLRGGHAERIYKLPNPMYFIP